MGKGAIEMSLGFIVAVVFAIVLLSLALAWLQGIIGGVTQLTDDLTQQAQNKLQETFEQTNNNFAIWPTRYDLTRGKELKMAAGIRNDAQDGMDHKFLINVIPSATSNDVCPNGIDSCTISGKDAIAAMTEWVTWDMSSSVVQIGKTAYRQISIKPSSNAKSGTYIFSVISCKDPITTPSACTPETLNWGGSAQQLIITVS